MSVTELDVGDKFINYDSSLAGMWAISIGVGKNENGIEVWSK